MKSLFKLIFIVCFFLHHAYASLSFLTISDIHYGDENQSRDGEDTGPEFLKISMNKFKELSKQVNFILCLGDLPTHSLFNVSTKGAYEKKVFDELYANDVGLKPIFYITGNNDSLGGNYQPFTSKGISPLNFAVNWHGACAHCKELIIDDSHMYQDGYYSSYVIPGNKKIMLIALNANQWAITPLLSRYPNQKKDALKQLFWLEQQLKNHHAEQLLIAMHEPVGYSYIGKPIWHKQYLQKFIEILQQNKHSYDEITLLNSHSHMDEFRKIHLDRSKNIYVFSTPSISRNHYNYPGMKVFSLNKKMGIENFTTYYTMHLDKWENQQYQALNTADAIFPHCRNKTLSQCLDQLSTQQVCTYIDQGLFYGVKSPVVPNDCDKVYRVN